MVRAYKFRIYPSLAQEALLNQHLIISRYVWNDCLAFVKKFYLDFELFPSRKTVREFAKHTGIYAQASYNVANRLYDTLIYFLKNRKTRNRIGFPRFKSYDAMKSITYTQYPGHGFVLDGKQLRASPYGTFKTRGLSEISGRILTLSLKRAPTGKWFGILTVSEAVKVIAPNGHPAVGIDLGIEKLATLSDGRMIRNPRLLELEQLSIRRLQKRLSHKTKFSVNYSKCKRRLAIAHERVANRRRDYPHKVSRHLVENYGLIAVEDLAIKNLARGRLSKSIYDASWGELLRQLNYKAESAGCSVTFVNPCGTSQVCWACKKRSAKPLSKRVHNCFNCGFTIDRDVNAARNILARATAGYAESQASGDDSATPNSPVWGYETSVNEEAQTKHGSDAN